MSLDLILSNIPQILEESAIKTVIFYSFFVGIDSIKSKDSLYSNLIKFENYSSAFGLGTGVAIYEILNYL